MNAGIYYFSKIFKYLYKGSYSIEHKIFPKLINEKKLTGKKYKDFFIDIGIPKNLNYFKKNSKNFLFKKSAFLDRDGVINYDFGYVHKYKNFKLKAGVIEGLKYLLNNNYYVFIVTNQAGLAKKKFSLDEYLELNYQIKDYFSKKYILMLYLSTSSRSINKKIKKKALRKPRNGMIEKILKIFIALESFIFYRR